jgi:hypothetical protein
MKHSEYEYFQAGYKYESGQQHIATSIRLMLDREKPHDRTEARHMIAAGRAEAAQNRKYKKAA